MARDDIERLRGQVGTFAAPRTDAAAAGDDAQLGGDAQLGDDAQLAPTLGLFDEDPAERAALATCHGVLAGKQVTEHEMRAKLVRAEHPEGAIEAAIARCRAAGLLDDAGYARRYVESRMRRGHGARRIESDLARRGIARPLVTEALAAGSHDGAMDEAAIAAARGRYARVDLDDPKLRARALRWLASRGFSHAQAEAAVRAVRTEQADAGG